MRKGFTILELLVATLLLGMLMTILTMIFNQSSISWRIGEASVAELSTVTKNISSIRFEADNLYAWDGQQAALLSVWDEDGDLRKGKRLVSNNETEEKINTVPAPTDTAKIGTWSMIGVGSDETDNGADVFTVNVMSAGPNKTFNDYDDIWSFPDEFD